MSVACYIFCNYKKILKIQLLSKKPKKTEDIQNVPILIQKLIY